MVRLSLVVWIAKRDRVFMNGGLDVFQRAGFKRDRVADKHIAALGRAKGLILVKDVRVLFESEKVRISFGRLEGANQIRRMGF